ncbi:MAG: PKD domain-containing protein, partial [Fulvivirga sp.]|nr:PKD domain-containing protein [Fulvivirga sp.]
PDIIEMEYFFDEDPGQGNGIAVSITPGTIVDINELLIPQSLTQGLHLIGIRAKDADGNWGFAELRRVYINPAGEVQDPPSPITQLEYFYNDDPGIGQATKIDIDPDATDVDIASILLPTQESIPVGTNTITMRAQTADGFWGFAETREFDVIDDCTQPIVDFSVELACEDEVVNFIDNSQDVQADAEYRWYLNGDDTPDDFTSGNTSFVYNNPGTYTVALAISQGQICYDSLSMEITIKDKPIVVFNAERVEVGNPTVYTVDQFNVPAGATWSWDFQSDGVVDDNTAGGTSFTFPAAGDYVTTLEVTDGNGCGTIYSKTVTVDPEGSGTTGPVADFSASTACEGSATLFTDQSTNIPSGATYSWDFDGDGVEDDNTVGSTQFTYPAAGDYMPMLTIDMGADGIVTHTEIAQVLPFPEADFTATEVCIGASTSFTDLSTNVTASATYAWDFDGDGVFDSNQVGDVSYTYNAAGSYSAVLVIDNGNGCLDTRVVTVNVIQQPTADFSFSPACAGFETDFTNLSSNVASAATYQWDFQNDGIIDSNTENPTFVFSSAGTYDVSLMVDNGAGCTDQQILAVTIKQEPTVDFEVQSGCVDEPVLFVDLSANVDVSATYEWDFDGDGIVDSNTVGDATFTYSGDVIAFATLTIDNGEGCARSITKQVSFDDAPLPDFSANQVCLGEPTIFTDLTTGLVTGSTYEWDFDGDGATDSAVPGSTSYEFAEAGTYNAMLTVDNNGCQVTVSKQVVVNPLPAVDLGVDIVICENSTLTLDPGPGYVQYLWSDGSNNQTLIVTEPGIYSVEVVDANGCEGTDQITIEQSPLPSADFAMTFEILDFSAIVRFDNLSENATSYLWEFGDGTTSSMENPSHEYVDIDVFSGSVFEVCLSSINSCDTARYCELVPLVVTGQDQMTEQQVEIYPNPSNGKVRVDFSRAEPGDYEIQIYDINGRLVDAWNLNNKNGRDEYLTVTGLSAGSYTLKVISTDRVISKVLIVK